MNTKQREEKKWKKHYPINNSLGGSYCKKCLEWSNMSDGLAGYECKATNKEAKANKLLLTKKS